MGDLLELFGVLSVVTGTPLLAYLGYTLIRRFVVRADASPALGPDDARELRLLRERVARLEQAVDVVAVEVERVGEAQRFTARLSGGAPGDGGARGAP